MATLALKCASRVQTRDLPVRVTSNFGKMISDIKIIEKSKKSYRIRVVTAAVTSLLTQIANFILKRTSRVQTRDLFVRIISRFGEIISYIKTTDTYTNHKIVHLNVTLTSILIIDFKWPVWS